MPESVTTPVAVPYVQQICDQAALAPEARALHQESLTPEQFVQALDQQGQSAEAIKFLAHALPKREGVWWAWVSVKKLLGPEPPPAAQSALDAVQRWIAEPNDDNAMAARTAADVADAGTPPGAVALAVYMSASSLAPPNVAPVPPPPGVANKMLVVALMLATAAPEPPVMQERLRGVVAQGLEVAKRIRLWEPKG